MSEAVYTCVRCCNPRFVFSSPGVVCIWCRAPERMIAEESARTDRCMCGEPKAPAREECYRCLAGKKPARRRQGSR